MVKIINHPRLRVAPFTSKPQPVHAALFVKSFPVNSKIQFSHLGGIMGANVQ